MLMVKIERLTKEKEDKWVMFTQRYVYNEYSFTLEWRDILTKSFNYQSFYYLIFSGQEIIGILPLFFVNSRILGNRIISIPFTDQGGFYFIPEVDDSIKEQSAELIFKNICKELKVFRLSTIEFRVVDRESNEFLEDKNFFTIVPYVKFILKLDVSWPKIYSNYSKNIIRNINKTKENIKINLCSQRKELCPVYDVYILNMKKLGSPPLPYAFFENLWDVLYGENNFKIFTAVYNNKLIGAITLIIFGETVYVDLIMSIPKYDYLFPKIHLYSESIYYFWRERKYRYYDFNRTRLESGVYGHKRKWGGYQKNIIYMFRKDTGDKNYFLDPSQRRLRIVSNMLRICPIDLLKYLGYFLRRSVGK